MYSSKSAWQTKGATMKLEDACYRYDVTEKQVFEANIETRCRSYFGNCYAVVKISDIAELSEKIRREEKEKEVAALKEKLGEEGYRKLKQDEADKKRQEEEKKKQEEEFNKAKRGLSDKLVLVMEIQGLAGGKVEDISSDQTISKTEAKSTWFLQDGHLNCLKGEKSGRATKYNLHDVIRHSHSAHGRHYGSTLKDKLLKRNNKTNFAQYAGFLKAELDKDVAENAKAFDAVILDAKAKFQAQVKESQEKLQAAKVDLESKEAKVRALDELYPSNALADSTNAAPQNKKLKTES